MPHFSLLIYCRLSLHNLNTRCKGRICIFRWKSQVADFEPLVFSKWLHIGSISTVLSISNILDHLRLSDIMFLICRVTHHPLSLQPSSLPRCLHLQRSRFALSLSLFLSVSLSPFMSPSSPSFLDVLMLWPLWIAYSVPVLQKITSVRIFPVHQTKGEGARLQIRKS